MLLERIIRTYVIIGILLYSTLFVYWENSISWYNILNLFTFASYAFILWISHHMPDDYYTKSKLGFTVFAYSTIFVGLYLIISDYYTENTFVFSESDARKYYKMVNKLLEIPIYDWTHYLTNHGWGYDDWGAPIIMSFMHKVFPSKLFMNFCYIMLNIISALCLFSIGKMIMNVRYAYIGSLVYSISSYSIFYLSCFLKEEIMVTLIISCFFLLYKYIQRKQFVFLALGVVFSVLILSFRTPVAIFVWMSFALFMLSELKNNIIRIIFLFLFFVIFLLVQSFVFYSIERYANGGQLETSYQYLNTNTFQKVVISLGTLIGPFPQIMQIGDKLLEKPFYGSGLLFKLLLFLPFWNGTIMLFKNKEYKMLPVYSFVVLEMIGLLIGLQGLELRKALPHVPFFIMASFWYMFKSDKEVELTPVNSVIRSNICYICLIFLVVLVWNTIRLEP